MLDWGLLPPLQQTPRPFQPTASAEAAQRSSGADLAAACSAACTMLFNEDREEALLPEELLFGVPLLGVRPSAQDRLLALLRTAREPLLLPLLLLLPLSDSPSSSILAWVRLEGRLCTRRGLGTTRRCCGPRDALFVSFHPLCSFGKHRFLAQNAVERLVASSRVRPHLVEIGPKLVETGSSVGQTRPKIDRTDSGQTWTTLQPMGTALPHAVHRTSGNIIARHSV